MLLLLGPNFQNPITTRTDLAIASFAWGFTLGFGLLTTWNAICQTEKIRRKYGASKLLYNPYVWMIWLEILVCLAFSIICWFHLWGPIPPSFAFYFCILTLWALQVQFLLQIIINRIAIIDTNRRKILWLKIGVAILITAINISVYTIWIPARLQISAKYIHVNDVWDRCEKVIYLLVDAALNWYFIKTVKERLVRQGLTKYDKVVQFNTWIIFLSLSMDCLIIGMMSLSNTFVYMQFHPLAYIVKLNIEMSMATLIAKVAKNNMVDRDLKGRGMPLQPISVSSQSASPTHKAVKVQSEVVVRVEGNGPWSRNDWTESDDDLKLLERPGPNHAMFPSRGMEQGMGFTTTVEADPKRNSR